MNGIQKDTVLISSDSGLRWKVLSRILYDHTGGKQKYFESESVEFILLSFGSLSDKESSLNSIIEKERKNIFQYFVKPVGHKEKPTDGERIEIIINEN